MTPFHSSPRAYSKPLLDWDCNDAIVKGDRETDEMRDPPMATSTASDLAAQVETPEEALHLIATLRSRFDFVGTDFTPRDVTLAVDDHAGSSGLDKHYRIEIIESLQGDYTYVKLGDRLAELGNEIIADEARTMAALLEDSPFKLFTYGVTLYAQGDGPCFEDIVKVVGFTCAQDAHKWGASCIGSKAGDVLSEGHPLAERVTNADDAMGSEIVGMRLIVFNASGGEEAEWVAEF